MRLIIFDVDGTLVDSQAIIHEAMCLTFSDFEVPPLPIEATRSIIGLTLNQAIARLLGREVDNEIDEMTARYKEHYLQLAKLPAMQSMLYEGINSVIEILNAQPETLLAIATGKSRRGLNTLIETHRFKDKFVAWRSADDCPSKPHPAMILECCDEAGCTPAQSVMVGDASFDMEMAITAGAGALGVSWGYQDIAALKSAGASKIVHSPAELPDAIDTFFDGKIL
ncbi:MAG: HAD-IA family hydrolase [Rhizobiaceae bacterium]|nr:HAD-IA family hydrolase [Rhizobiaceae bacterium]